jgi:site-specific DNA-methyltransferase (adenine-specific)
MLAINQLYNLDCFEFLKQIDDGIVNLAVIDPPYNMNKAEWDTFKTQDEFFAFTFSWIDALIPKLHKDASLYIFNTPFNCSFILKHLLEKGLIFQNWITWDKRDGLSAGKRKYSNGQETILFFTKSLKHTFNYEDIRLPYQSAQRMEHAAKKGILKNGKRWFPNPKGKLCGEVWHITSQRHKQKINGKVQKLSHITTKPIEMMERIVKASSKEGDLILDCFVGSGAAAVAAKKLKRNFICSDSNQKYIEIAKKEIKNAN